MSKKKIIFVGWVNKGKKPVCGETTKNQFIIAELEKYCDLTILDFYEKNKHPWIYLQALWAFVTNPKSMIIFSTSAKNVYSILKMFKSLGIKRDIIYWVIGGAFATYVKNGIFDADVFKSLRYNLVQCKSMITDLNDAGVMNAKFVSNFKPIKYYPDLQECQTKRDLYGKWRFVFLSRIMVEKGCDYILDAVKILNEEGYEDKFVVDFYGKIFPSYRDHFLNEVNKYENVSFLGLLDLTNNEGYDVLTTYHAMLFPTYWSGEGFAGVFIDSFIAGVPVLASDWAHNAESIDDGRTGVIYPVHSSDAIRKTMIDVMEGRIDLKALSNNARDEAPKYSAEFVMNKKYLKSIGLVE